MVCVGGIEDKKTVLVCCKFAVSDYAFYIVTT